MQLWFEAFQFAKAPYEKLDPYKIDFERLVWDRPDLKKAKEDIDKFIDDTINKLRVALKIFGPAGSGKTWLTRIIQKELSEKLAERREEMVFLYAKVPRMEPTFQVVYRIAIEYFLANYFEKLRKFVRRATVDAWEKVIDDHELALCFSNFSSGTPTKKALARKWLIGDKLSASELSDLELTYSLDSDYERFEMLRKLIEKLLNKFSVCVLVIDELENAPTKLAGQISDGLRDLLDLFSERFALIASFTAQKVEWWYDLGYTEALGRRFDYTVELSSLDKNTLTEFLRLHHKAYRKEDAKIKDEIYPFTEDAAIKLLELMPPQYHYPGYFLPNCKDIARLASGKEAPIDAKFVETNFQKVSFK
jgi:hypothetical protein